MAAPERVMVAFLAAFAAGLRPFARCFGLTFLVACLAPGAGGSLAAATVAGLQRAPPQATSLLQRSIATSKDRTGVAKDDPTAYPVIVHSPPHPRAAEPIGRVHPEASAPGHRQPDLTETEGNEISKTIGTDLLGDPLEPTHKGVGRSGATHDATKAFEASGESHEVHHKYLALLFFFGVLAIGSIVLIFLDRFLPVVPYTVALFVAGMMASIVHTFKPHDSWLHWPSWFESVDMWQDINPHLLFYAFLPALIFGEAMRLNVQLVSKCFAQVFLLACPGVVLGTFLTAYVGKYVMPYGWDWPIALVFGTILSATDPVAVVALFNTLGVSPRLTMIISGESLLNDGTAIVCFALLLKIALGASLDAAEAIVFFGHMTMSAVLVGGTVGYVAVFIIGRCADNKYHSDSMIQVVVTLACGYLTFFLAESEFSTSGVISTVSAGFVVAYYAWPRFVSRETMHTVWETVEFIGNTVIFFLAGLIFSDAVLSRRNYIGMADFGWLLVLYVCVTLIRALMIATFWIPLNVLGKPIHWKEGLVMVWSGLRGAVSLSLAIIVDMEPGISKQMGSRIMFHVGGIAALTFLVNASTAAPLLRFLGITKMSRMKERMLSRFAMHMSEHCAEVFEAQLRHPEDVRFSGANQHVVRAMVPALRGSHVNPALAQKTESTEFDSEQALGKLFREAYLRVVQNNYWEAIGDGIIPRNLKAARILLNSTDEALEQTEVRLSDWDTIEREVGMPKASRFSKHMSDLVQKKPLCWVSPLWHAFSEEAATMQKIFIALSFQEAHARAQAEVPKYFAADDALDNQVQQLVAHESSLQCRKAAELLESLPPDVVELGKSEMLARKLLHLQRDRIGHLREKGLLTDSEASLMDHSVQHAAQRIANMPKDVWATAHHSSSGSQAGGMSPAVLGLMPHFSANDRFSGY